MQDERLCEQNVATPSDAVFDRRRIGDGCGIRRRDPAARVRPKRQLEAAILDAGRIKMDAGEEHALQQFDRRLGVPAGRLCSGRCR